MSASNTVFLWLEGPLQAWGVTSRFAVRDTGDVPSKSGVLGLVCAALGLRTADDPSNSDPRFLRARVRHEVIPVLEAVFPAARRRLVALAEAERRVHGAAADH